MSPDKPAPAEPLPYATPPDLDPRVPRRRRAPSALKWTALGLLIALVLVVALAMPAIGRLRPAVNVIKCASNLRQIAQAMLLYANENGSAYPDEFDGLIETQDITPAIFVCPACADTRATGATTRQVLTNLHAGGHLSYVYCGKGLTAAAPAAAILAFDAGTWHDPTGKAEGFPGDGGRNFLFADGQVKYLPAAAANHAVNELAAGHNPPRP